jgi:phosphatidylcholine synthase
MASPAWYRAFSVHIFTASGTALAFLALLAAVDSAWSLMFLWLGVALLIDGLDGPLARHFSVSTVVPRWSGDTLDLVIDFLTYVFVPAYAIANAGLLPPPLAVAAGIAIVATSAIYFADTQMKTEDNYFRGFPALWNAVAFYLILLNPPVWATVVIIIAFLVATFAPVPFIHPLRVKRLRGVNIAVLIVWSILALIALASDMSPEPLVKVGLCVIAAYVLGAGLLRFRE